MTKLEKICYLFGAMDPETVYFSTKNNQLIIAADGGLRHLEDRGIVPDYIVGDFDSLGRVPAGDNIIRHPVEKDDTDMLLAIKTGLDQGCRTFVLYGGLGGRIDHAYANYQALCYLAERGAFGWLLGGGNAVTALRNGTLRFPASCAGTVSVFCAGGRAAGVTLEGLYYPLHEATLTSAFPLGVSNQFTGVPAAVTVRDGTLLVMWQEAAKTVVERL